MIGFIIIMSVLVGVLTGVETVLIFPGEWLAAVVFGTVAFMVVIAGFGTLVRICDCLLNICESAALRIKDCLPKLSRQ
jgi:hypothetical protein